MRPDFLFAMPSWLSGAARTLDVAGQFDEYNDSKTGQDADSRALHSDWRSVGDSILAAMARIAHESQKSTSKR